MSRIEILLVNPFTNFKIVPPTPDLMNLAALQWHVSVVQENKVGAEHIR